MLGGEGGGSKRGELDKGQKNIFFENAQNFIKHRLGEVGVNFKPIIACNFKTNFCMVF